MENHRDIQYSSFDGRVWVDIVGGSSGTEFPFGTPRQPVNNIADAVTIATERGFKTIQIVDDITLDTGDALSDYTIRGESPVRSTVTVNAGAVVTNSVFENCTITGTLDGGNVVDGCQVDDLAYFNGIIKNSIMLDATVTLAGGVDAHLID